MNCVELMKFAKSKGITMKHPALRTEDETKKDEPILPDAPPPPPPAGDQIVVAP